MVHFSKCSKYARSCKGEKTSILFLCLLLSFYLGALTGMYAGLDGNDLYKCKRKNDLDASEIESLAQQRVIEELQRRGDQDPRFGQQLSMFATGATKARKEDFVRMFDYGNPIDEYINSEVLILYGKAALPSNDSLALAAVFDDGKGISSANVEEATKNCDVLDVVLTANKETTECVAVVNDYQSYHLQKWERIGTNKIKIDRKFPLQHVTRRIHKYDFESFPSPSENDFEKSWKLLRQYLNSLDHVMEELKPIAQRIAKNNTIVVMACNFGQSALLVNFVCFTRARGLDISNVLVFATDAETLELAEGLGLAAFYDEKNFKDLPSKAAAFYGDKTFGEVVHAKVVAAQMINMLGYDLVFQDVDVVWYRDPIEVFHNKTHPYHDFDIIFQGDGSPAERFLPFSANSGFYFARCNERTRYLFTAMLYNGEMIVRGQCDQKAMNAMLVEHSSLFGLKAKVISVNNPDFLGGYHYSYIPEQNFAWDLAQNKIVPRIFHMNWTANKKIKLLFMRQMGMWYLKDQCIDKKMSEMMIETGKSLSETCCSSEPLVSCHFGDRASVISCKDSPLFDEGGHW